MNIDIDKYKIFEGKAGSQLYGTATPESDTDYVGIIMPPEDYVFGLLKVEEINLDIKSKSEDGKNDKDAVDRKFYELRNFARLALQNNPNILEILFSGKEAIIFKNEYFDELQNNTSLFLSKESIFTRFISYSTSQKHKMIIKEKHFSELLEALNYFQNQESHAYLLEYRDKNLSFLTEDDKHFKMGDLSFQKTLQVKKVISMLSERMSKITNRYELVLKHGYDCYHIDTEFLTMDGWKKYNDIKDDELVGTMNPTTFKLEFQIPQDRVKKRYNGIMYEFVGNYTRMCVTPNHRMFVSRCHRQKSNNFNSTYGACKPSWQFIPLENIIQSHKTMYHAHTSCSTSDTDYIGVDDDYLILLGLFVSEGTFQWRKEGKLKCIRISQTIKGKRNFFKEIRKIMDKYSFREYSYKRKNRNYKEFVWSSHDKNICKKLFEEVGHMSKNKKLPNWIFNLSKRQSDVLLNSLILGDGTKANRYKNVYYTSSKKLADWVQILSLIAGRDSNSYFYKYNGRPGMYQVMIRNGVSIPKTMVFNPNNKKSHRNSHNGGKKIKYRGNIVCFSVPNECLITRFKGKIAIQGNTKFGSHLLRLLLEGEELLLTGKIEFPLKYAELLLEVKRGKYEVGKLLEMATEVENRMRDAKEKSSLPSKPRFDEINNLVKKITKQFHGDLL